jgi:hypothetical protein
MTWSVLESAIPTGGCMTTWTDSSSPVSDQRYYKVAEEAP